MTISLYQRLGGDEGIAAHLANPLVKTRFEEIRDWSTSFLLRA